MSRNNDAAASEKPAESPSSPSPKPAGDTAEVSEAVVDREGAQAVVAGEASSKQQNGMKRQSSTKKTVKACRVPGCSCIDLSNASRHCLRHRVCAQHLQVRGLHHSEILPPDLSSPDPNNDPLSRTCIGSQLVGRPLRATCFYSQHLAFWTNSVYDCASFAHRAVRMIMRPLSWLTALFDFACWCRAYPSCSTARLTGSAKSA
eukprot:5880427-Pyramimonas_sp.AAC.1